MNSSKYNDIFPLSTPILFLIFNRLDTVIRTLESIEKVQPKKLYIACDGPRPSVDGEIDRVQQVRNYVLTSITWPCEVITLFQENNLGCRYAVSTALDWFFDNEEEGIILEDDCLPNISFFSFCSQMLKEYRYDTRVMMICGTNYLGRWKPSLESYSFSYYGGIWGWASWRRAWDYFDIDMNAWKSAEVRERIRDVLSNEFQYYTRARIFEKVSKLEIDTWDYQWSLARLSQSGLSIVPSVNLVSNIGFGPDATHTKFSNNLSSREVYDLNFPVHNNNYVCVDREYDQKLFYKLNGKRVTRKIKFYLSSFVCFTVKIRALLNQRINC